MPRALTSLIILILAIGAIGGWVAYGSTLARSSAIVESDAALASRVESFVKTEVAVTREGERYERLSGFVTGPAAEMIDAREAADPEPMPDFELVDINTSRLILRSGERAIVEIAYTVRNGQDEPELVGELAGLVLDGDKWLIETIWRINIDDGSPLIPTESATPAPSATPDPAAAGCGDSLLAGIGQRVAQAKHVMIDGTAGEVTFHYEAIGDRVWLYDGTTEMIVIGDEAWTNTPDGWVAADATLSLDPLALLDDISVDDLAWSLAEDECVGSSADSTLSFDAGDRPLVIDTPELSLTFDYLTEPVISDPTVAQ